MTAASKRADAYLDKPVDFTRLSAVLLKAQGGRKAFHDGTVSDASFSPGLIFFQLSENIAQTALFDTM